MARKAKSSKPAACQVCAGTELVRRITTYPVPTPCGPPARWKGRRFMSDVLRSMIVRPADTSCRPRRARRRWLAMSILVSAYSSGN